MNEPMDVRMQASEISGAEIMSRIDSVARFSESPDGLTRRFLTREHRQAMDLAAEWMREAGMAVREDAIGNVVGRYEGATAGAPTLLIGSHLDTVVMAGKYDGMLGVVSGIACVAVLARRGRRLPFAVEVVGFGDEEGVRFQSTFLGSRAIAGTFDPALLDRRDADGLTLAQAMRDFGLDPDRIGEAARRPEEIRGYLELHIEQGPVLESKGLPVGTVETIIGARRFAVTVDGVAGHAGTVPMTLRKDALLAASECALTVEQTVASAARAVGTVGRMHVAPGAANVIPGKVEFSIDVRSPDDDVLRGLCAEIARRFEEIGQHRAVRIGIETVHETKSVRCAEAVMARIDRAIEAQGWTPLRMVSGAGHDAMAMAAIAPIGMIFVRCKAGVSHNPAEAITAEDAETGARTLLHVIENFEAS